MDAPRSNDAGDGAGGSSETTDRRNPEDLLPRFEDRCARGMDPRRVETSTMNPSAVSSEIASPPLPRPGVAAWVRVAVVCLLLVASGVIRLAQVRRVDAALASGRQSPFPLETIPHVLGSWKGEGTEMDDTIVRATGSTDRITRRYVDQRTGVGLDVIVLYGPTSDMFIHRPELCYPKAGYTPFGDVNSRPVPLGKSAVPFKSLAYTKGEGGQAEFQEIYCSWRYNGQWFLDVSDPKRSERIPGMYKVQVARRISATENRAIDNPAEAFVELLVAEIERRIAAASSAPAP
jgi:hypothetical protein